MTFDPLPAVYDLTHAGQDPAAVSHVVREGPIVGGAVRIPLSALAVAMSAVPVAAVARGG